MSGQADTKIDGICPLTAREFHQFRKLAYDAAGINLQEGKEQLLSARLSKKMRELRITSYEEYYRFVTRDTTGEALISLIDALTTNHTGFFREAAHFDFLRNVLLPALRERERISIWCAASSTGEEPYSIVFSIIEELGMAALPKLNIVATDISTCVLAIAQRGVYPAKRFRDFPAQRLRRYLLKGEGKWKDWYMVRKEIRAAVRFERLNLISHFSHPAPFPAIFCRNVMIYFDQPTQERLVTRMAKFLEPGGYLFIGHAESLNGLKQPLQYVRPATYVKPRPGIGLLSKGFSRV
jgi:chemotaxis protein methyltransferase CheR